MSVTAQTLSPRRAIARMLAISRSMNSMDSLPGTSANSCCLEEALVAGAVVSVACTKFDFVDVDLLSWKDEAPCCCVGAKARPPICAHWFLDDSSAVAGRCEGASCVVGEGIEATPGNRGIGMGVLETLVPSVWLFKGCPFDSDC